MCRCTSCVHSLSPMSCFPPPPFPSPFQGDVWICMELMDKSLHQLYKLVYDTLKLNIPENVVGKMAEAVRNIRCIHVQSCFRSLCPQLCAFKSNLSVYVDFTYCRQSRLSTSWSSSSTCCTEVSRCACHGRTNLSSYSGLQRTKCPLPNPNPLSKLVRISQLVFRTSESWSDKYHGKYQKHGRERSHEWHEILHNA